VGPRAGPDGRKISPQPGFYPGPSSPQSVAIPTELPVTVSGVTSQKASSDESSCEIGKFKD